MDESASRLVTLEADCKQLFEDAAAPVADKPRVAVWGLVGAGKSSLLNMLAGHVDKEYFKSGSVRTTRTHTELEQDTCILVDTPGLGVKFEDSQQAFDGLDDADVVLFVHAPPGELDQEELDLLLHARVALGEQAEQRLVIALTRLDKHPDGSLNVLSRRIGEQLQDALGLQPLCVQVSSLCYRQGWAQDNTPLVERSGIPDLLEHLEGLAAQITAAREAQRREQRLARKAELLAQLDQAIASECETFARLQQPYIEKTRAFNRSMAQLRKTFTEQTVQIERLHKRLEGL